MFICKLIILKVIFTTFLFIHSNADFLETKSQIENWFHSMNDNLEEFNKLSASVAWRLMIGDDDNGTLQSTATAVGLLKSYWKNSMCEKEMIFNHLTEKQKRMYSLLCRGAKYTSKEAREISDLLDTMSIEYSSTEVCVSENFLQTNNKQNNENKCLKIEPDLENLMIRQDLSAEQLLWIWKSWHDTVGPEIKQYYPELVRVLNSVAENNGYKDIGEVWREELEIPNLEETVRKLYMEIQPLYMMLHGVVRHVLYKKFGPKFVNPTGPIPANLLGNMWAQDWSSLINLLIPKEDNLNLNEHLIEKNWTIINLVELAEDMYVSLGLPKMTKKFWKYSKFEKDDKNSSLCHGTAANMFDTDDYRMLLCATLNMDDFYVIHHEMGHIQYYMAYKNQPTIFKDGTNSAFQESIGDAIMIGVMVPQHLYRLGLLTDEQILDKKKNLDIILLLQQALTKIPQIPHALLIDLYRWNIFNGKITPKSYNADFWFMNKKLRGIEPPEKRSEFYFDAASKFHIPDNTPYIRYFLSSIVQMQMFKGMCELTLYGNKTNHIDTVVPFPLHRCDIYGSKNAGEKLKSMMSLGASENWQKVLKILTGKTYLSVKPLLEYYKPIYLWLEKYIKTNNVFIGW